MLILTQPQKIFGADFPGQSQFFRAQPNPFTGHALTLIIIITDAEMFLEVFLGVLQVMLRLGRDHASDITRTERACGVAATPPRPTILVNWTHEQDHGSEARQPTLGGYHTDREYAHELGDPLRTVVEASSKLIAEETAAQLGFGDPWAHPVNSLTARRAQWLQKSRLAHQHKLTNSSSSIHI
jgi:hypothetical protein